MFVINNMSNLWYYVKEYGHLSYYVSWLYGRTRGTIQPYISTDFNAHEIIPNLFIGDIASSCNFEELNNLNITHIITAILGVKPQFPNSNFIYKNLNIRDTEWENIYPYLDECVDFIDDALSNGGKVFVHCVCGVSRSATIIAAYLMKMHDKTCDDAIHSLQSIRPIVDPNPYFRQQLKEYEKELREK